MRNLAELLALLLIMLMSGIGFLDEAGAAEPVSWEACFALQTAGSTSYIVLDMDELHLALHERDGLYYATVYHATAPGGVRMVHGKSWAELMRIFCPQIVITTTEH